MGTLRLLRLRDVEARIGLKKSAIYELVARGEFPAQIHLGKRAVAWKEDDIDAWIEMRVSVRRQEPDTGVKIRVSPKEPFSTSILSKLPDPW